jgi:hypothetical protein
MQIWLAALIGALIQACGSMVVRVLISLGIGFVAYKGIDVAISTYKDAIFTNIAGLPPQLVGLLGYMKVGTAINIIFSAYVARIAIAGVTSGVIRRMVFGVGDVRRAGG